MLKQLYYIQAICKPKPGAGFKLPGLVAAFVLLVFFPAAASEQVSPKQYYDAASIILGGESHGFVIGKGESVSITAGQSVRLLPGTKIEAGGKVVVEVRSHAKPESREERHSVLLNPELLARPFIHDVATSLTAIPDPAKLSASGGFSRAVMPVQLSNANKSLLTGKTVYKTDSSHSGLTSCALGKYFLDLAWGERPETIKVLRT